MITKEVGPTLDRMKEVSCISTIKVDELVSMQSLLDTLEKIRSGMRSKADSAGTLLPICAMIHKSTTFKAKVHQLNTTKPVRVLPGVDKWTCHSYLAQ